MRILIVCIVCASFLWFASNSYASTLNNTYFDNNTQLRWKIYFIPTCPKYVNFGYCEGFTTFSRDIWVIGNQTYDEAMEICKHEVCHNIFWTRYFIWQENFCERYSDTLHSVKEANRICDILMLNSRLKGSITNITVRG